MTPVAKRTRKGIAEEEQAKEQEQKEGNIGLRLRGAGKGGMELAKSAEGEKKNGKEGLKKKGSESAKGKRGGGA